MRVLLFHNNQLIKEWDAITGVSREIHEQMDNEIYQEGYIRVVGSPHLDGWYRCDGTPFFSDCIPKETRLLALII